MYSGENDFRVIEKLLDKSLSENTGKLLSENIEIKDNSLRNYHDGKGEHLFWSFSFIKKWHANHETAQVKILISYYEPASAIESPLINLHKHNEVYKQYSESRISERENIKISLENVTSRGVGELVLDFLNKGVSEIETAL